ncbi:ATP phosphoribosyltransferase regulatory subunit [Pelistega europaea]|uniref:ATP phosphoribosyltransferase regulatory subunit n=1 Tax=Pelistega europaea TaxID=106147 RepID=A0A7Y4P5A8_9BURK|nr:ATP phosphoribosyltransferase regulatory subunit [Pelistega europaea]NOL49603.1 ATP phosphoribosyltransferase regulatory subunit [Pelistega europaea]
MSTQNWLLPDYLSDILPAEARRIEELRRRLLDLYRTYGFEMVTPPLVEYTDSLLAGQRDTLYLQTCKLVDQISGRSLGVRADMTPQITRIDAHLLNREGVTRLCYCGTVLHARPAGLLAERELMQIGAEIYGYAGVEADYQIIQLALESLSVAGVHSPRVDLNHPGITAALIDAYPAFAAEAETIYTYLKDKDEASLAILLDHYPEVPAQLKAGLLALPRLYGGVEVLDRASALLPALPGVQQGLDSLRAIIQSLDASVVSIDLADVTGYAYHSGVIFALYADGWHEALVRGGRYDNVGAVFGRARAATGFSLDLRKLAAGLPPAQPSKAIRAPWGQDKSLLNRIKALRNEGHIVVQEFPNSQFSVDEFSFKQELVEKNGEWVLRDIF